MFRYNIEKDEICIIICRHFPEYNFFLGRSFQYRKKEILDSLEIRIYFKNWRIGFPSLLSIFIRHRIRKFSFPIISFSTIPDCCRSFRIRWSLTSIFSLWWSPFWFRKIAWFDWNSWCPRIHCPFYTCSRVSATLWIFPLYSRHNRSELMPAASQRRQPAEPQPQMNSRRNSGRSSTELTRPIRLPSPRLWAFSSL